MAKQKIYFSLMTLMKGGEFLKENDECGQRYSFFEWEKGNGNYIDCECYCPVCGKVHSGIGVGLDISSNPDKPVPVSATCELTESGFMPLTYSYDFINWIGQDTLGVIYNGQVFSCGPDLYIYPLDINRDEEAINYDNEYKMFIKIKEGKEESDFIYDLVSNFVPDNEKNAEIKKRIITKFDNAYNESINRYDTINLQYGGIINIDKDEVDKGLSN